MAKIDENQKRTMNNGWQFSANVPAIVSNFCNRLKVILFPMHFLLFGYVCELLGDGYLKKICFLLLLS